MRLGRRGIRCWFGRGRRWVERRQEFSGLGGGMTFDPGNVVNARVSRVEDYGVWLESRGIRILVLIHEMGLEFVSHPEEYAKIGDLLEVEILRENAEENAYSGRLKKEDDREVAEGG